MSGRAGRASLPSLRMNSTIRRACEDDAERIARLSEQLGYPNETEAIRARIRAISQSKNDLLIVATQADEVAGWLQAQAANVIEIGWHAEIVGLVVDITARRSGIARQLITEAESWARSIKAEAMVVRSNAKRRESHIFYPAVGYELVKTQKVYRKSL